MWNPLCTNFPFPQAVGEDMVNTFWRYSNIVSNCCAWNTVHNFKNRFYLFCVAFMCHQCWGSFVRSVVCLLPILNGIQHTVLYEGACFPKPSFNDLSLRELLPYRTWNFINVLMSSVRNFLVVFPDPLIYNNRYHKDGAPFVTAALVPLVPHMRFEFSHTKHYTVLPSYTKLLKWFTYVFSIYHSFVLLQRCT